MFRASCWIRPLGLCLILAACDNAPIDEMDAGTTDPGTADAGTTSGDAGTSDGGSADPCEGVDCSDLDGACQVGVCDPSDGSCRAESADDGAACDDGDACTSGDVCTAGVCGGDSVDCSSMDDMCNVGVCDPATGACGTVPVADGTACSDEDLCTETDVCTAGVCSGESVDCSSMDDTCQAGACDPTTGACMSSTLPDGTSCDDGHACTGGDVCGSGACDGALTCTEPVGISPAGSVADLPRRGSATGGTAYDDACPTGSALVGVSGDLRAGASYLGRIRGICAPISITGSGLGPYTVTTGAQTDPPLRGLLGGGASYVGVCPANSVVVGFDGRAGALVDQLELRCAPLVVSETASAFVVAPGTPTAIAPVGGTGGSPFPTTDCPAGEIATVARIRAGDSVDGFSLGCQAIDLLYAP